MWRAAAIVAVAVLAYLPSLTTAAFQDGEADGLRRGPSAMPAWADVYRLPASLASYPAKVPTVLAWLVRSEVVGAKSVTMHHLVGVAMHAGVAVMLWLVLRRLGRPAAWLAAAAFAAWPGGVPAVEWVTQRGRLWAAALSVAGVLLLLRAAGVPARAVGAHGLDDDEDLPQGWRRPLAAVGRPVGFAAAALLLVVAAWCQPTIVGVGLIGVLLVLWRRGGRASDWAALAPPVLLAVVVAVGLARHRPAAPRSPFGHDPVAGMNGLIRGLWETGRAVGRAWPSPASELASPGSKVTVLTTAGIGAAAWATVALLVVFRKRLGTPAAVAGVAFVLLLPTVVAPPALVIPTTVATPGRPGAGYLTIVPLLVVVADLAVVACRRLTADLAQRLAEIGAAVAAVGLAGAATAVRSASFGDTESVLRAFVAVDGNTWSSRSLLAGHDLRAGDAKAAQAALAGLTTDRCPDAVTAVTQGDVLEAFGAVERSLPWYDLADRLDPSDTTGIVRRAAALLSLNRPGDAIDCYAAGIKRHPASAELRDAFGVMLANQGDAAVAIPQYEAALAIDPDFVSAHVNLATALINQGKLMDAADHLRRAVELDPDRYEAFHNAGIVLAQLKQYAPAARMLNQAVLIKPDSPEFRNDLGVVLVQAGQFRLADFQFDQALVLRPGYVDALHNKEVAARQAAAAKRRASVQGK